eukprot:1309868-Prymnesium_polylepis.1
MPSHYSTTSPTHHFACAHKVVVIRGHVGAARRHHRRPCRTHGCAARHALRHKPCELQRDAFTMRRCRSD